jgi:hypothetical protein
MTPPIPVQITVIAAQHEQAQAERLAGQLLTQYVHTICIADRARIMGRALWEAGRAAAYGEISERIVDPEDKPRGRR